MGSGAGRVMLLSMHYNSNEYNLFLNSTLVIRESVSGPPVKNHIQAI